MLFGWEGNCRSDVALTMRHTAIYRLIPQSLLTTDEHPMQVCMPCDCVMKEQRTAYGTIS